MEVMLERVQFKFASIIGELCSEPLVLSQFAVWVDMRLAEYKLKGSISLDCSGDSPDPIWIKGVTFALKEKLKAAEESAAKAISGVISHRTGVGQDFDRQGRSDSRGRSGSVADGPSLADITQDLHVKPEPIDETSAFPVSLYTNNEKINSPPSHRKRPIHVSSTHPNSATSSQSYTSEIGEPMPKSSRLSVDEQDLTGSVDPDNTSLLSIIGMNDSQLDSSTNNDNDDDIIECDMTSFQTPSQATSDNPGRLPAAQGSSKQGSQLHSGLQPNSTGLHGGRPLPRHIMLQQWGRRQRSQVMVFERWLNQRGLPKTVNFENLTPDQLDPYLAKFFLTAKKHTGVDWSIKTLINTRSQISRFLQERGYGYSITKSPEFRESQQAFRLRTRSTVDQRTLDVDNVTKM